MHAIHEKADMPFNLKPEYIHDSYESTLLGTLPNSRYRLIWEHADPKSTTKKFIIGMCKREEIDILVVGYHGVKGPKKDATIMGSAVATL